MMDIQAKNRSDALGRIENMRLFKEFGYINAEWVSQIKNSTIPVHNPADGSLIGSIPALNGDHAIAAVDAAQAAFAGWASLLPQDRGAILRKWFELILENKQDLALLMTLEQGKPISEALGEIEYAASFVEFYAEEAKRPNIEGVTSHLPNGEVEVWREPVGVIALVTPWNFPSAMITRKAAAALAAGCTCVVHPSRETPFSATALAELGEQAGLPAGAFNVLTGYAAEIVEPWTKDKRVRAISFTGSTEIGKLLYGQSADTMKHLVMELGGHAPFIVYADADLDHAVKCAISAKFATSGQDCLAANRIYVERAIYNEFIEKFVSATKALTLGSGLVDPDIGPLMNAKAIEKQIEHVDDALAKGARLMCGGKVGAAGALFFEPTVIADVSRDALICRDETFGPIAPIIPFEADEDVIALANDSDYGLVAYLHTTNAKRIYSASRALQYGMVAINRTKVTGAPIPFGGMKQSGLGREGSRLGLEEFTEIKYVCRDFA